MNLHRIEDEAEWNTSSPEDRNWWQKVAATSHGIVTIGNVFSAIGLISIPLGLGLLQAENHYAATIVLALGRLCDLLDGWLADLTATKSPLGEKIDATVDKVATVWVVSGLAAVGTLPSIESIVLLIGPHVVIAFVIFGAFLRGKQFHPSLVGKLSMACIWVTILVLILLRPLEGSVEDIGKMIATALLGITFLSGLAALFGYIRQLANFRKEK